MNKAQNLLDVTERTMADVAFLRSYLTEALEENHRMKILLHAALPLLHSADKACWDMFADHHTDPAYTKDDDRQALASWKIYDAAKAIVDQYYS